MSDQIRRGHFLVVIGPDGVGKTSLAGELMAQWPHESAYFHFRPPVLGQLAAGPSDAGQFVRAKPPTEQGVRAGGWLRLGLNVARFWLGYLRRVRPAIKRGSLVVGDRWAYGYLAQPVPLKFFGPEWLARAAVRLMPQPDLVVRLTAPASVIRSRKAELTEQQIEEEHALWGLITARRILEVDARRTPGEIAEVVLSALQPAPDT